MNLFRRFWLGTGKVYRIHRTLWQMPEILYEQETELLGIYGLISELGGEDTKFGDVLEAFYARGVIPRLFKTILKPFQPTFLHRLWNQFWSWKHDVNPENLAKGLKRSEWGGMVADFFLGSDTGMMSFENSASDLVSQNLKPGDPNYKNSSAGKSLMMPILPMIYFLTNFSSLLRTRTSPAEPLSEQPAS